MESLLLLENITEEEASEIYEQGREAVIFKFLEMAKVIHSLQEQLDKISNEKINSKISSPSGAVPVYKKENKSDKRNKKAGRKKGHEGESRKIPDKVDEEIALKLDYCPDCGEKLPESDVSRDRYIEDIPDVKVIVKKYRIYRSYCKRCDKIVEPKVTEALPKSNIGLNLMALTAWFHYGLGITISHIIEVLNYHLQFKLSKGGLYQIWKRMSEILYPWYEAISEEAKKSAYLHGDETGWRVNGQTHWLWCFCNKNLTWYIIDKSRGSPALQRFFEEIFQGVLITDFWKAYKKIVSVHQACYSHLFRELAKVTERNKSEEWIAFRKRLVRWMRDAMKLDKKEDLSEESMASRKTRLYLRLDGFVNEEFKDHDCLRIQKRLKKYKDSLLTFLDYEDVTADNNKGEREIRPAVIMRKNICHNKSKDGAEVQAILMTIYRTLKIRGYNPIAVIAQALTHYIKNGNLPELPEPLTSYS